MLTKKELSGELYDKFGEYPILYKWGSRGKCLVKVPGFEKITPGTDIIKFMAIPGFVGWADGPVYEVKGD